VLVAVEAMQDEPKYTASPLLVLAWTKIEDRGSMDKSSAMHG